jgi:hypothetical protein
MDVDPNRRRHGLNYRKLAGTRVYGGIPKYHRARHA